MQKFMEILLKFDEILTKFWQNFQNCRLWSRTVAKLGRAPRWRRAARASASASRTSAATRTPFAASRRCRSAMSGWGRLEGGASSSQSSATTHHSFGGSFSAGSTPISASKYAFWSIFQDLQENHLLANKFVIFSRKKSNFAKFLRRNFWRIKYFQKK